VAAVHEPYHLAGASVHTSISIGIAHHRATSHARPRTHLAAVSTTRRHTDPPRPAANNPTPEQIIEGLLKDADVAMYTAKANGKGRAVDTTTTHALTSPAGPPHPEPSPVTPGPLPAGHAIGS
jgi:predicted signal transduction protein with EAL and GGDEF domain